MTSILPDDGVTAWPPLAEEVRRGLLRSPKQLPPRLLYDALGSALFEAICHLPWYRITRAEHALLARHAPAVGSHVGESPFVVELGPGGGEKLLQLLEPLARARRTVRVHLVDVSPAALAAAERAVSTLPGVQVSAEAVTYEQGLDSLPQWRPTGASSLVVFLGSNIGNFTREEARAFLSRIARAVGPGDRLLLGVDLVKARDALIDAYDDPLGVTAAFNRNLLVRINRELGADFDIRRFAHRALWNEEESRVEMHLVSCGDQVVDIPKAGCQVFFVDGESIWTESSSKYTGESLAALLGAAGFDVDACWTDDEAGFALVLARVAEAGSALPPL